MSKIEQGNVKYLAGKTIIDILFVCFTATDALDKDSALGPESAPWKLQR